MWCAVTRRRANAVLGIAARATDARSRSKSHRKSATGCQQLGRMRVAGLPRAWIARVFGHRRDSRASDSGEGPAYQGSTARLSDSLDRLCVIGLHRERAAPRWPGAPTSPKNVSHLSLSAAGRTCSGLNIGLLNQRQPTSFVPRAAAPYVEVTRRVFARGLFAITPHPEVRGSAAQRNSARIRSPGGERRCSWQVTTRVEFIKRRV